MKIGSLKAGSIGHLCGVLVGTLGVAKAKKAKKDGAELLELRIDTLKKRDLTALIRDTKKLRAVGLPLLLTVRSFKEGSKVRISNKERLELFKALTPLVDAIDIELGSTAIIDEVVGLAKKNKKKVITSYHNFKSTPTQARLDALVREGRERGADIVKVAATIKGTRELRRLTRLLVDNDKVIVIAMGKGRGATLSRVYLPLLGSLITYAKTTGASAPGQLSVAELKKELK